MSKRIHLQTARGLLKLKGDDKMLEKIKTIAKYTLNTLTIVNALLIGLDPIWGIPYNFLTYHPLKT